jgi:hypothetical protein
MQSKLRASQLTSRLSRSARRVAVAVINIIIVIISIIKSPIQAIVATHLQVVKVSSAWRFAVAVIHAATAVVVRHDTAGQQQHSIHVASAPNSTSTQERHMHAVACKMQSYPHFIRCSFTGFHQMLFHRISQEVC